MENLIFEIVCIDFQVVVAMTHVTCLAFICGKNTEFTQVRGGYYEAEMTNHAWLITDDRIIIDITGDQFHGTWNPVYVGMETGNYEKLSRIITQDNFDIRDQSRLWNDYNVVLKYLKEV